MTTDRSIDDLVYVIEHDRRVFFECLAEKEAEASLLAEKEAEASQFSASLFSLAQVMDLRKPSTCGSEPEFQILRAQLSGAGVSAEAIGSVIGAVQSALDELEYLQSALEEYRESRPYRLGYALLHPWRKLRTLYRRFIPRL